VAKGGRGAVLSRRWSVFLPGRGRRCLAAERGECGQRSGDKEMSWGCARGLREAR
jgi:hypothetical protein